jgi:hypothetical protein
MGFDPKSDEQRQSRQMDLSQQENLERGAHAGYPWTTAQGHRGIVWVTGQEAFCETLIVEGDTRIKISGGF